jgi:hypothetical protein
MWSGSPRSSWCPLCAVEVCVRTSMAWSSVSLLCVSFGWTRRFLRRIFVVAPHNVSFATCNSEPGGGDTEAIYAAARRCRGEHLFRTRSR